MQEFIVTLTANSSKELVVKANTETEANNLVYDLYLKTDIFSFTDHDVNEISIDCKEIDNDKNEDIDFEQMFFSASDEQKELILNFLLGEQE
jgi:hypothetical protein